MLLIEFSKFRELNCNTEEKSQFWSDNIKRRCIVSCVTPVMFPVTSTFVHNSAHVKEVYEGVAFARCWSKHEGGWFEMIQLTTSGVPRNFFRGGGQQIQLRTEDREDGDLGAVAPQSGVLEAAVIWYNKFYFI